MFSSSVNAAETLKPQFFVTRQNGTMVPLIAMDELPSTVNIREVPRILSPHDISGMTGVGTFNTRHMQHIVDGLNKGFQPDRAFPDKSLMASAYAPPSNHAAEDEMTFLGLRCESSATFPFLPKAYRIHEQTPSTRAMAPPPNILQARTDHFATTPRLPTTTSIPDDLPIRRAPGVKEYCSYWLRHGECDYAQQGCLYRHEMPLDRNILEKLGLRDIPRWYREKHGLGSYLASGNMTTGLNSTVTNSRPAFMDKNWRTHPAEVLLEGTARRERRENEIIEPPAPRNTPVPDHRAVGSGMGGLGSSTHHGLHTPPTTPTEPPTIITPIESTYAPKPTTSSIPIRAKSDINGSRLVPASTETMAARQIRETIKALDAYEERERKILAEKDKVLMPQRRELNTNGAMTPSTSTASSASDEARTGARAAKSLPPRTMVREHVKESSPRAIAPNGTAAAVAVKKRVGRSRRTVGREMAGSAGLKERIKADRLVNHERILT